MSPSACTPGSQAPDYIYIISPPSQVLHNQEEGAGKTWSPIMPQHLPACSASRLVTRHHVFV